MDDIKALVFVGTEGIYHDHEGQGKFIAKFLSATDGISADFSQDYGVMAGGLASYDTVLFYTDVGHFSEQQEAGLLEFVEQGGGFFGLHTAAASFRENQGYHAMLNAFFDGHSKYMDFKVDLVDREDPITRGLENFTVTDELYYLKHDPTKSHHLMQAYDETKDETHVMAFHHDYGAGRVFYFSLGHDMAVLQDLSFQEIVRRGVRWAATSKLPAA
ncbi:MAG: ThuA domain-containing protein [Gemmatimonadetes bacterium]|jgi:type 1 glutamine amidotransferase|nr:ThuA domain-containing protein [Gemmatimonadota bacterium]MDE0963806.1 ThuA domain-containing protein [Candidatus Latescibacterota bacterium]MBT5802389.1 ThuA domain-containing protein [Gemmatimonadota bacterium]MBT6619772.1 ThuA domain-containing protein [Gemmatimonadota bacterium]MBT7419335.1 ThuA domain-containing protein [Gemmatimonadota bacterium]